MNLAPPGGSSERCHYALLAAERHVKPYEYYSCCLFLDGPDVDELVERATGITYRTMRRYCDLVTLARVFDYEPRAPGFTLWDDTHVGFHKSYLNNRPCYYLQHSSIEWVFLRPE